MKASLVLQRATGGEKVSNLEEGGGVESNTYDTERSAACIQLQQRCIARARSPEPFCARCLPLAAEQRGTTGRSPHTCVMYMCVGTDKRFALCEGVREEMMEVY